MVTKAVYATLLLNIIVGILMLKRLKMLIPTMKVDKSNTTAVSIMAVEFILLCGLDITLFVQWVL